MKFKIKLLKTVKPNADGYMVCSIFSHRKDKAKKTLFRAHEHEWDPVNDMVRPSHPDYDFHYPRLLDMHREGRRIAMMGFNSCEDCIDRLHRLMDADKNFCDFAQELVAEMKEMARLYDQKGKFPERNRVIGNMKVYQTAVNQFRHAFGSVGLSELRTEHLQRFKMAQLASGNEKTTVHNYLRTLRAIYNKGKRRFDLPNRNPFEGVFSDLGTKSYSSKKKYLSAASVRKLEAVELGDAKRRDVNLWLLQFYLAGADLIDVYFMPRERVKNGRVYLQRGKVAGAIFDVAIHPKAQVIIDRYASREGDYLFPWRKDLKGYETFRRRMQKTLAAVQVSVGIEIEPLGGILAPKVARHTFATMAKRLGVEDDLLRELMGHQRDDVDNYYKDRFSEEVRDAALFRVIGSV